MSRNQGIRPRKRNNLGRIFLLLFILLLLAGGYAGYKILGPNTGSFNQGEYLYIHTGTDYQELLTQLHDGGYVKDIMSFDVIAKKANLPSTIKPGKYKMEDGASNLSMIRKLRSGKQEPVRLVINKLRTKDDFIKAVCSELEADSTEMRRLLNDTAYLAKFGFTPQTAMCVVIPDTYEFYWSTNADNVFRRLEHYYDKFWTEAREQQAKLIGLTPTQISILASIIDEETNKQSDKGLISSVYINRLAFHMPLQADPTLKFAIGDFAIRRILNEHVAYDSPYNTYMYPGLPPGPICTPQKSTIDAVLKTPKTEYLYFCAKEDFSGYHNFAKSYTDHMKNAKAYQKALNERGILN